MNVNILATNRVFAKKKKETVFSTESQITFFQFSISYFRKDIDWYTYFLCCVWLKAKTKNKNNPAKIYVKYVQS